MRSPSLSVLLYLAVWTLAGGADPPPPGSASLPRSPTQLLERAREGFRNRDPEALERLFSWDRVLPYTRRFSQEGFRKLVTCDRLDLRLAPLGPREPEEWADHRGVIYRHNLPAEGVVEVVCGSAWRYRWAYGRQGLGYRFTLYVAADSIPDPENDPILGEHDLTKEESDTLESYYRGTIDASRFVSHELESLRDDHPTFRRRAVRWLSLVLENAAEAESSGWVPWVPTPYVNDPYPRNRARELRERIAFGLPSTLPACALPLARFFLDREPANSLRSYAGTILGNVAGSEADSLILELIERPRPDRGITSALLHAAAARGLRPSRAALARFAAGPSPSLADSARVANDRAGYPPLPRFDADRAYRLPATRGLLAVLDTLLIDPPPVGARFVRVDAVGIGAAGDTTRWNYRGWLERESADSVAIVTPSGKHESFARTDTLRSDSGEVTTIWTNTMRAYTAGEELAAEDARDFGGFLLDQVDPVVHRLTVARWLDRRGDRRHAAAAFLPLVDAFSRDSDLIDHVRRVIGIRMGYRMLGAFVGERDYPRTMELARLIRTRYPDTMFSLCAARLLVELPERMDDFHGFRLPTPGEWMALQQTLNRDQQIDYLCRRLRLLNGFQNGQPGGLGLGGAQFAEPEGLSPDASWGLGRGRTRLINPLVQLTERDSATCFFYGDSLGLGIADVPHLAEYLREDWFILGIEFCRDFRPERRLYRTSEILAYLINDLADERLCETDDWPSITPGEREARIRALDRWTRENVGLTGQERMMRRLDRARRWSDLSSLLPKLIAYDRKDAVPKLLTYLERGGIEDYEMTRVLNACRRLDPKRAGPGASRYLRDPRPGVRMEAGLIELEAGNRREGRRAIAEALSLGTHNTLPSWSAVEGAEALIPLRTGEAASAVETALRRGFFDTVPAKDQARLLTALIAAGRPFAYRWMITALQDSTPSDPAGGMHSIPLRRRDRIAAMIADEVAPRRATLHYDWADPEGKRALDRARIRLWLVERLTALKGSTRHR